MRIFLSSFIHRQKDLNLRGLLNAGCEQKTGYPELIQSLSRELSTTYPHFGDNIM